MAFRQNYGQQRAERNRLKQAKKEAREQKRRDGVLRRKTAPDAEASKESGASESESSQSPDGPEEGARS
ncbi:MAG: hypothetical protein ACREFP_09600 [Acetobacteraceae bacterium]